jgi:PAS domain S-box-containing protein
MKKPARKQSKSKKLDTASNISTDTSAGQSVMENPTTTKKGSKILFPLNTIDRDSLSSSIESMIHLSRDIIVVLEKNQVIQTLNPAACQALGIGREKAEGKNWFDHFVTRSMRTSARKSFQDLFSGKRDSMGYLVIPIVNKMGEEKLIEWEGIALQDSGGTPEAVLLSGRDITQQKRIEKELIQSEWDMALAQKIARLGSWVYNMANDEIRMSDEMVQIFGTSPQAFPIPYKVFLKLIHPDDRQRVADSHEESLRTGKGHKVEYRVLLTDGTERTVYEESKIFLDDLDNPLKVRGIVQDISERKKVQDQLIHAEKLSSIGKLSASIAHEINNPLFGIRNVLERTRMCVPLKEADERFIDMAISETDRIAKLTRRLNTFFRPTREHKELIHINRILEEITLLIHKELKDRKIKLQTHYAEILPEVMAVPDQIKQVALNLVQNAMEAIPESGGEIVLTTFHQDSHLYFSVADNGSGMTEDSRKNIFEPFFTTKSKTEGTGLGLWVTNGIVQSHGGGIEVHSECGNGTTFTVSLPIS